MTWPMWDKEGYPWKRKSKRMTWEQARDAQLQRSYGINFAIVTDTLNKQKGLCLGCKKKCKLCIDHDHQTGRFRGLLCSSCNLGLGMLKDNPKILRNLIHYLAHPVKLS